MVPAVTSTEITVSQYDVSWLKPGPDTYSRTSYRPAYPSVVEVSVFGKAVI